jgi:RNA polymerase sigma-70 factor (ECF subfamily)
MSRFPSLVEHEIPRLRRYARALTRAGDRADDLVQDTLVRALTKGHLWQPGTDIRAWLFTIMHNQYVNTVRREMRDSATVDIEQMSSTLAATTDPTAGRQLAELDRALARLPDEQREVILLVGLEGMAYESAAQILGVPIGTVRSRLSRGRDSLRELMGEKQGAKPATGKPATKATPEHINAYREARPPRGRQGLSLHEHDRVTECGPNVAGQLRATVGFVQDREVALFDTAGGVARHQQDRQARMQGVRSAGELKPVDAA